MDAARPQKHTSWQDLVKNQIRRRYDYLCNSDDFPPNAVARAGAGGYDMATFAALPNQITAAYSGSGNPLAGIDITDVTRVADLGCGAGIDALLTAAAMPAIGRLIAIDFSTAMIARLVDAHRLLGHPFNLRPVVADIEALPLFDTSVDLVIANASLNLAVTPDRALGEAFRILVPGGRLEAADFIRTGPLPPEAAINPMAWSASIGGVMEEDELKQALSSAGFENIKISGHRQAAPVIAVHVSAAKPVQTC